MNNIDKENSVFWDQMCGSILATSLGITDDSPESLEKYDKYYLDYYPYLLKRVPVHTFTGKSVMEVGLGYGTLSQKIAENCERYRGLDIAEGPVKLVNTRMSHLNNDSKAIVGSIKECPFDDESFDAVVAIGCYHHTGDLRRAINETARVLKKGGTCYLMVYNKYSYRQWKQSSMLTLSRFVKEYFDLNLFATDPTSKERKAFDANLDGTAAPETQFFSIKELKSIMDEQFDNVSMFKENFDPLIFSDNLNIKREKLLGNLGRFMGLDVYFEGRKK